MGPLASTPPKYLTPHHNWCHNDVPTEQLLPCHIQHWPGPVLLQRNFYPRLGVASPTCWHTHRSHSQAWQQPHQGLPPPIKRTCSSRSQASQPAFLEANPANHRSRCSWALKLAGPDANPVHQCACSSHSTATKEGHIQPTQGTLKERTVLVTGRTVFFSSTGCLPPKSMTC